MLPWNMSPDLPWRRFMNPLEKWAAQPSFVIGEYLFFLCAGLALWHALKSDRKHVLVWVAAFIAGTANDLIFMALPLVDNFWQAQATVMITPRLPLYICCVYICFMYFGVVAAWRLRLPPLPTAALAGLLAELFYAPYDIVGAKFSWWTWHDTDQPIAQRLLGAPFGSTMWVITFVAAFAYLIHRGTRREDPPSRRTIARTLALVAGLSTIVMVLQMTALQELDGGTPGPIGLVVIVCIYAALIARGWSQRAPRTPRAHDAILAGAVVLYFTTLTLIMAAFDPATHVNESLHQTAGPCGVEAIDITGMTRHEYLCVDDFDEDFSFECAAAPPPPDHTVWYAVCGRPHTNFMAWLLGVGLLGVFGIAAFLALLWPRAWRREALRS